MRSIITYTDVHEFVRRQPKDSHIGQCGNPFACLVTKVVQDKHPQMGKVAVSIRDDGRLFMEVDNAPVYLGEPTAIRLGALAGRFDELGDYEYAPTRDEVLSLFEGRD